MKKPFRPDVQTFPEVMRYLTSIVHHEMENLHDDVHVPDGIIPIREGADSIDINTETTDGKNTFHSMARAVFQIRPGPLGSALRFLK
jgi:hypothetical protein